MSDITAATGFAHPSDLQPHHLVQRMDATTALPIDRIYPFLPKNILIDAPEETIYAHWWNSAQAESFRPLLDLVEQRASSGGSTLINTV